MQPVEEPPVTVEKKRRKLDEIVLGLATSKNEQKSIFDAPSISSLTSGKKTQITPSVSVTPASAPSSQSQSSQQQKPFTITVTSVPGNSSKNQAGSSSSSSSSRNNPGLDVLQSMAGLTGMSSKDSLNALFLQAAQQEQQAFLKQQQKMIQQMPANSTQRKQYEAMFADMKQMAELSAKLGYSPHDSKVNKWLQEQTQQLANQALELDYLTGQSSRSRGRGSSSQQNTASSSSQGNSTSMQQSSSSGRQSSSRHSNVDMSGGSSSSGGASGFNWKNLTGEENVAVINKINGKRLTGSKAPQLKRLTQWLTDNPAYEIDPKWAESISLPPPSPMAKPSPTETSSTSSSGSKQQQRPSSSSSGGGQSSRHDLSSPYGQTGQGSSSSTSGNKKSSSNNNSSSLNYPGLAGLNASLLSSIPGLGAFDPKNNPLMMPFGGVGGMAGMAGLQNMNNMNLFANLAGLSGLAGMDPQSLATMMQAAGFDPASAAALAGTSAPSSKGNSGSSSQGQNSSNSKSRKSDSNQQSSSSSSKVPTSSASSMNAAANSAFPFFFPNPSLLYTPLGLGGLNPYSLPGGMAAYDQLAQQCNLLNGAGLTGKKFESNVLPFFHLKVLISGFQEVQLENRARANNKAVHHKAPVHEILAHNLRPHLQSAVRLVLV